MRWLAVALLAGTIGCFVAVATPDVAAGGNGERRCRAPAGEGLPGWARQRRMTVLVDSVLLSGKDALRAAQPCKRVVVWGEPALMVRVAQQRLRARGRRVAPLVVVGLGYNSLWERGRRRHRYWAARFDREARLLIRTLRRLGARQIFWVTLREPRPATVPAGARDELDQYSWYFPYVNGRLRYLDRRIDDLALVDWRRASDRPGLTYDSIHLNTTGAALMVRTIKAAIRAEARRQARERAR